MFHEHGAEAPGDPMVAQIQHSGTHLGFQIWSSDSKAQILSVANSTILIFKS